MGQLLIGEVVGPVAEGGGEAQADVPFPVTSEVTSISYQFPATTEPNEATVAGSNPGALSQVTVFSSQLVSGTRCIGRVQALPGLRSPFTVVKENRPGPNSSAFIPLTAQPPQYLYTQLSKIRPALLAEASRDAETRGQRLVAAVGGRLGKPQSVSTDDGLA